MMPRSGKQQQASPPLPIEEVLPQVLAAVRSSGAAVLQAPPGAGKTTRVPLALLDVVKGRILVLEPRRLAARAAASRMAGILGQAPGGLVGYSMRGAQALGAETRIEVITEGLLTRKIQSDPELTGIGAILFDEIHERSIHSDLGLALALEIRAALRPDLVLIAMSATLDAAPVARLMGDAPIITSEGRAFPVETRYRDTPVRGAPKHLTGEVAQTILRTLEEENGNILVFLPGAAEIRAVERLLPKRPDLLVAPLYGALSFQAQQMALRSPPAEMRKVVLASAIAETSLTIEGIRIVIDAGLVRVSRYDPRSGMARLVTEKVSRATADQRQGRAGRLEPGICYRLWSRGEHGALPAFPAPQITTTDLTPLALELARWGSGDLPFLTSPPGPMLEQARMLLQALGALDVRGHITAHGQDMAAVPAHPRLAHMILSAAEGVEIAALLQGRDILKVAGHRQSVDLGLRLRVLRSAGRSSDINPNEIHQASLSEAQQEVRRLTPYAGPKTGLSAGATLSLAYPDRIARRRAGTQPRYLMSGGKGAVMPADDPLATADFLVMAELDGDQTEAKLRQALPITLSEIKHVHAAQLYEQKLCQWSRRHRCVITRKQLCFGALVLEDQPWQNAPEQEIAHAVLDGVRSLGLEALGWTPAARRFQMRVLFSRAPTDDIPDFSDAALIETLESWLLPYLSGCRSANDLRAFDPLPALRACLSWEDQALIDARAPDVFITPAGSKIPISYDAQAGPEIAVRLQELFGLSTHPVVGAARLPLRITLLSPALRPVQTTSDLPGFWAESYADVRKDMRGRYPRHPWPEDPGVASPMMRIKPRRP